MPRQKTAKRIKRTQPPPSSDSSSDDEGPILPKVRKTALPLPASSSSSDEDEPKILSALELHARPPAAFDEEGNIEGGATWVIATGLRRDIAESPPLPDQIIATRSTAPNYQYAANSKVGEGQYGDVNVVTIPERNDEKFALKKMDADSPSRRKKAQREVYIQSNLKQENICRLKDSFRTGDIVHMLLEVCDMDLDIYIFKHLNKTFSSQMKLGVIKHILHGIYHGIAYMHGRGVMHRDIKPGNILLKRESGGIKICDFGSSRKDYVEEGRRRHYSTETGTVPFMAPEMLFKCTDYGCEVDLWSIACIISKMFKGKNYPVGQCEFGNRYVDQLSVIADLCGNLTFPESATIEISDGTRKRLEKGNKRQVRFLFEHSVCKSSEAIDLLDVAFTLAPEQRWSASRMTEHLFFTNTPTVIKNDILLW